MLNHSQITTLMPQQAFQTEQSLDTPESRVLFLKQASVELQIALQRVMAKAPWLPSVASQKQAIGLCADIVDDLFHDVSEDDREAVDAAARLEQQDHEEMERLFVRKF